MAGDHDDCLPMTAIYDPDLTLSLPPRTSAASGMNAMAHAVETLYGPDINPVVEEPGVQSRGAARVEPPPRRRPPHRHRRAHRRAIRRLARRRVPRQAGVEHALAQRVRQAFGLDHSHCHAIFTPYAIAFNAKAAPRAMQLIARALGDQRRRPGSL